MPPTCEKVDEGSEIFTYTLTTADIDYEIVGIGKCPDPSAPSGYGEPFVIGTSESIEPDTGAYNWVRWVGSIITPYQTVASTFPWQDWSLRTSGDYLTLGPLWQETFFAPFIMTAENSPNWVCPAAGPIPWRATVTAIDNEGAIGGYGKVLGEIGINQNNVPTFFLEQPAILISNNPQVGQVYTITGKWQFSNNQSTILAEWEGRTE